MKIKKVTYNNRKKVFSLKTNKGEFDYPYSQLILKPSKSNPIKKVYVDEELGARGFTYELSFGEENSVILDQVLEYNKDPDYLAEMLLYKLSIYAKKSPTLYLPIISISYAIWKE